MARMGAALAVAIFAASLGPGMASAQERPESESATQQTEPQPRAQHRRGPETPRAQLQLAVRVGTRAEGLSRRVQLHLDEARRDGDARRAQCLDDVLSQSNAVVRMAGEATERLQQGIALSDDSRRRHAVSVLGVLARRVTELDARMRVCNGEDPSREAVGRTQVIVTVDRDVPDEDPTRISAEPPSLPYIPPPASPAI